jgi:hypothetical protein
MSTSSFRTSKPIEQRLTRQSPTTESCSQCRITRSEPKAYSPSQRHLEKIVNWLPLDFRLRQDEIHSSRRYRGYLSFSQAPFPRCASGWPVEVSTCNAIVALVKELRNHSVHVLMSGPQYIFQMVNLTSLWASRSGSHQRKISRHLQPPRSSRTRISK